MNFRFTTSHAPLATRFALLLALAGAAPGCVAIAGGGIDNGADSDGDDDGDEGPGVSEGDEASRERCRAATENAKKLLENRCASCHGGGAANQGGFNTVLDINAMIDTGKVVPSKPESSPLYAMLRSGAMPPKSVSDRPSSDEVQYVHDWIDCGAPSQARAAGSESFVDVDERLETMLKDLKSFDDSDRPGIRYIDLYNLANAGYSEKDLDVYRDAVSFLLNSLSSGLRVVAPQRVDDRGLMFRVELDDYGWTAETWATIVESYPYAVQYDKDSQLFPYDEVSSQQIREETGEAIPYIQADWLIAHAVRPPLYYDILGIPGSLAELEADLGLDISANIENEQVRRAGFRDPTDSRNDRVVERHELDGGQGALWISYDFADGLGKSDVFAHPLDYEADAMHIAYNLPNGMQAYLATDASGQRVSKSDNAVVQDPLSRDGAVEPGLSCFSCHGDQGIMAKADEVRQSFTLSGVGGETLETVLSLYAPNDELMELFAADAELYTTARSFAVEEALDESTMHAIDDRHLDELGILEVSAVLGIRQEELERALRASPQRFPASVRALMVEGGVVKRDGFDAVFPDVVRALSLGEPVTRGDVGEDDGSDEGTDDGTDGTDGTDDGSDGSDGGNEEADAGAEEPPADEGDGDGYGGYDPYP
jgi:mono/diheme cytochrome c family protein